MNWIYSQPMGGADALRIQGPVVLAQLVPSEFSRTDMETMGLQWGRRPVRLLTDTGAAISMVDDNLAEALNLPAPRFTDVVGISPAPLRCPLFHAELEMGFERTRKGVKESCVMRVPITLAGMPSTHLRVGYQGLLGRDFLQYFQMVYDGATGEFALRAHVEWARRSLPPKKP